MKIKTYDWVAWSTLFGDFLGKKFNTMKWFGLEGCESFIPGLKGLIDRLVELGYTNVIMGMPHRGWMNVLTNVVRKPLEVVFSEF